MKQMKKLTKVCGNCLWNISSRDVENIIEENDYQEGDKNFPEVGCGIGKTHNKEFTCEEHHHNGTELDKFDRWIYVREF